MRKNHPDISRYFEDIRQIPLLSREEEVEAGLKIAESGNRILWAAFQYDPKLVLEYIKGSEEDPSAGNAGGYFKPLFTSKGNPRKRKDAEKLFYGCLDRLKTDGYPVHDISREVGDSYASRLAVDKVGFEKSKLKNSQELEKVERASRDLEKLIFSWNKNLNKLVEPNLRLVVSFARGFYRSGSLSLTDYIQEGNMGLLRAAEKYDPTNGTKFSTYAVWWVRQAFHRSAADKGRTVRIPVHIKGLTKMVIAAQRELELKFGEGNISEEDIAEYTRLDLEQVSFIMNYVLPLDQVGSLDAWIDDEGKMDFHRFIPDTGVKSSDQHIHEEEIKDEIERLLSTLSPRDERIMRMRFGIGYDQEHTFKEIGEKVGLTRERVRQIQNSILIKLKVRSIDGLV